MTGGFSRRFSMKLMIPFSKRASLDATRGAIALLILAAATHIGIAQAAGQSAATPANAGPPNSGANNQLGVAVKTQQQLSTPGPALNPQSTTSQNGIDPSYRGSLVQGKATAEVLPLTIDDAILRGLQNNLGLILQTSNERQANGSRLESLQALLPTVTGGASVTVQQIDLAAYGLKIPGINPIVGPFQVMDVRGYASQNVLNLTAFQQYMASKHNFQGAKLTAQDARDLVVLTVGNAYLLCVADEARIKAVQAELDNSKLSFDQATGNHDAGISPRIDVLRAQVDYQSEQQSLISANNQLAKDKLALARVIGLPLDQKFELADGTPFQALDTPDPDAAFQQAYKILRARIEAFFALPLETLRHDKTALKAALDSIATINA